MIQLGDVEQHKQRHEERTARMRSEVQANRLVKRKAVTLAPLRHWVGHNLIRLGTWLKPAEAEVVDPSTVVQY